MSTPRKMNFRRFGRIFGIFLLFVFLCLYLNLTVSGIHDSVVMASARGDFEKAKQWARFDPYLSRVGFEEHMTPLGAAARSGNVSLVRYFLSKGVDVDRADDKGLMAKGRAASTGQEDIIRILEQAGAK